jgi:hypothetical protein
MHAWHACDTPDAPQGHQRFLDAVRTQRGAYMPPVTTAGSAAEVEWQCIEFVLTTDACGACMLQGGCHPAYGEALRRVGLQPDAVMLVEEQRRLSEASGARDTAAGLLRILVPTISTGAWRQAHPRCPSPADSP